MPMPINSRLSRIEVGCRSRRDQAEAFDAEVVALHLGSAREGLVLALVDLRLVPAPKSSGSIPSA